MLLSSFKSCSIMFLDISYTLGQCFNKELLGENSTPEKNK